MEENQMFEFEHNQNTGTIELGCNVQVTGNPIFYWKNTEVKVNIHKVKNDQSIWFNLSIKQISEISWESTIAIRSPVSVWPIEVKFDRYFHTCAEALEALKEKYPDECENISSELFS
ncbi:MAG: hypothetical protein Q8L10_04060 [Candidatus Moranbacteria bacterium]|nr:hypothetical protein [Candidatus Moranbacteria bacterium]